MRFGRCYVIKLSFLRSFELNLSHHYISLIFDSNNYTVSSFIRTKYLGGNYGFLCNVQCSQFIKIDSLVILTISTKIND